MKFFLLLFCFAFAVLCIAVEQSEHDAAHKLVTEIFSAIDRGDANEVQSLIDRRVQLNGEYLENEEKPYQYPLHYAITRPDKFNEDILRMLIKNGADIDAVNGLGRTPLYEAVDCDNLVAVKSLLENGANANTYNEKIKESALQHALNVRHRYNNPAIIELLLQYGADVNQKDFDGQTPLHTAVITGYKKAIEMFIEKGSNVNAVDNKKMTPLHYLASLDSSNKGHRNWTEEDNLQYADLLINHGADVCAKAHFWSDNDETPLHLATSQKLKEFLQNKMASTGQA